jgi:hypothetical protein
MMLVDLPTCLAHDQNHEKAQMFHLHMGCIWLKDAAWPDLPKGRPSGFRE